MSQLALARPLLQIKRKEKKRKTIFKTKRKRKRKEILNNDLAVLPSHDTSTLNSLSKSGAANTGFVVKTCFNLLNAFC